jgi:hypothetical protein
MPVHITIRDDRKQVKPLGSLQALREYESGGQLSSSDDRIAGTHSFSMGTKSVSLRLK